MKRSVCAILVMSLLFSSIIFVSAKNYPTDIDVKTVTCLDYGYSYTEYTDESNQIIRTYKKQNFVNEKSVDDVMGKNNTESSLSVEATKALLSSLGMEEGFVNKLSEDELLQYANSSEIMAVSSYTKTDAEGNVVNVTKEEALNAAGSRAIVPAPDPGGAVPPSYSNSFTDSYMNITFVVSYLGNGRYKFSVDSVWLTMPIFRGYDSLGACAQNMTVENITRSGWYSYTMSSTFGGNYATYDIEEQLNSTNFKNAVDGNWYGSAALFDLPNDVSGSYSDYVFYRDYRVHYEYVGQVTFPEQQMNFNTTAAYCHTFINLSGSLSVGIDANGGTASISITPISDTETRTVEFDTSISYTP